MCQCWQITHLILLCPYLQKTGRLFWMKQADTQLVASVQQLQHVECQRLRNCQHHSNQPDQSHLHCFPQRDAHPFHPAPWCHCMVAAHTHTHMHYVLVASVCPVCVAHAVSMLTGQYWGHTDWGPLFPLKLSGWMASAYRCTRRTASPQLLAAQKNNREERNLGWETCKKMLFSRRGSRRGPFFFTSFMVTAAAKAKINKAVFLL